MIEGQNIDKSFVSSKISEFLAMIFSINMLNELVRSIQKQCLINQLFGFIGLKKLVPSGNISLQQILQDYLHSDNFSPKLIRNLKLQRQSLKLLDILLKSDLYPKVTLQEQQISVLLLIMLSKGNIMHRLYLLSPLAHLLAVSEQERVKVMRAGGIQILQKKKKYLKDYHLIIFLQIQYYLTQMHLTYRELSYKILHQMCTFILEYYNQSLNSKQLRINFLLSRLCRICSIMLCYPLDKKKGQILMKSGVICVLIHQLRKINQLSGIQSDCIILLNRLCRQGLVDFNELISFKLLDLVQHLLQLPLDYFSSSPIQILQYFVKDNQHLQAIFSCKSLMKTVIDLLNSYNRDYAFPFFECIVNYGDSEMAYGLFSTTDVLLNYVNILQNRKTINVQNMLRHLSAIFKIGARYSIDGENNLVDKFRQNGGEEALDTVETSSCEKTMDDLCCLRARFFK